MIQAFQQLIILHKEWPASKIILKILLVARTSFTAEMQHQKTVTENMCHCIWEQLKFLGGLQAKFSNLMKTWHGHEQLFQCIVFQEKLPLVHHLKICKSFLDTVSTYFPSRRFECKPVHFEGKIQTHQKSKLVQSWNYPSSKSTATVSHLACIWQRFLFPSKSWQSPDYLLKF